MQAVWNALHSLIACFPFNDDDDATITTEVCVSGPIIHPQPLFRVPKNGLSCVCCLQQSHLVAEEAIEDVQMGGGGGEEAMSSSGSYKKKTLLVTALGGRGEE